MITTASIVACLPLVLDLLAMNWIQLLGWRFMLMHLMVAERRAHDLPAGHFLWPGPASCSTVRKRGPGTRWRGLGNREPAGVPRVILHPLSCCFLTKSPNPQIPSFDHEHSRHSRTPAAGASAMPSPPRWSNSCAAVSPCFAPSTRAPTPSSRTPRHPRASPSAPVIQWALPRREPSRRLPYRASQILAWAMPPCSKGGSHLRVVPRQGVAYEFLLTGSFGLLKAKFGPCADNLQHAPRVELLGGSSATPWSSQFPCFTLCAVPNGRRFRSAEVLPRATPGVARRGSPGDRA